MNTTLNNWIQKSPYFWVHQESNWIVRDYLTEEENDGWVILDNNDMMISCEWRESKEECMKEVEYILAQEKEFGHV